MKYPGSFTQEPGSLEEISKSKTFQIIIEKRN